MNLHRLLSVLLAGSLFSAVLLLAGSARAQDITLNQCIAANDQGLDLRKRGQLLDARKAFAQCASPSCGEEMNQACQKGIADIGTLLPSVVFVPKNGAGEDVAGVKLSIDGKPYAEKLDGGAVTVDPGEHEFRFEVLGQAPVTKRFVLREAEQNRREEILIGPPAPPAAKTSGAPAVFVVERAPQQEFDSTGSAQRTTGTLLLAVALPIAMVTGIGYGVTAATKWNSAQDSCKTACGPESHAQKELDDSRSAATASNIAFSLAGVALVGGIVLKVTAPKRRPIKSPSASFSIVPTLAGRGAALVATGSFL